jgi:hypothetical protein
MTYDKEILKLKRRIVSLETKAAKAIERRKSVVLRKVTALLKKLGYPSLAALTSDVGSTKVVSAVKVRKRANITDVIRKGVVSDLKTGKSAAAVAKKHGISRPSVNNIKKAAGLTKSRKAKKAVAKVVAKKPAKTTRKTKKGPPKPAEVAQPSTSTASPAPSKAECASPDISDTRRA